jgi:hypothetical protein
MAEMVVCNLADVPKALKERAKDWRLVAVIKADYTSEEVDPDRDGIRTMSVHSEVRELYFERVPK